jgi:hypothetical protein
MQLRSAPLETEQHQCIHTVGSAPWSCSGRERRQAVCISSLGMATGSIRVSPSGVRKNGEHHDRADREEFDLPVLMDSNQNCEPFMYSIVETGCSLWSIRRVVELACAAQPIAEYREQKQQKERDEK